MGTIDLLGGVSDPLQGERVMSDVTLFIAGAFVSFLFVAGVIVRGAWFFIKLDAVIESVQSEGVRANLPSPNRTLRSSQSLL